MKPRTATTLSAETLIDAAARGTLTEAQARQLYHFGPEVVTLAFLAAKRALSERDARIATLEEQLHPLPGGESPTAAGQLSPSTPSGQRPVYTKPPAKKGQRKPGGRKGHAGTRRPPPTRIDQRIEHRLPCCPECGGPLTRCHRRRTRVIEDIPETVTPIVTEHTIHRDYCPRCKKSVEPVVPEAMPGAMLGHHVIAMTGWLHYGLGLPIARILDILGFHFQTALSAGGLTNAWHRLAEVLVGWYEQIAEEARQSAVLHADETGWRVEGQTHWLWCFANGQVCYYMIDRCRGSPALQTFFTEAFAGTLVHDFWGPYDAVAVEDRQYCLVHLLRECDKVDQRNHSAPWQEFAARLRRLLRDGIRLRKRPDFSPARYASRIARIHDRLTDLAVNCRPDGRPQYSDADAVRLSKRLRKHWDYLFTFLDKPEVPADNNLAERAIRPAVLLRKNGQSNRSPQGAATQAVLMSVFRTMRLRGLEPTRTIAEALRTYLQTGKLPPLPSANAARG